MRFKKVKYDLANGYSVVHMEAKDLSVNEAVDILKIPNLIKFSAVQMTPREYFNSVAGKEYIKDVQGD